MNNQFDIQKSLAKITLDEKGWRKSLAKSEGSYSSNLAQENLHRLKALREVLLSQLTSLRARRQHVMKHVIADGNFTDHRCDGVCEELAAIRAEPFHRRHVEVVQRIYLSTEKAVQDWNHSDTA